MAERTDPRRPSRGGLIAGALAASVLLTACTATTSGGTDYVASGRPVSVPSEPLAVVDGDTFAGILVGLRGRPVVVNVWASWCGPCRVEAPLLQDAAEEYGDRVAFLGVASRDEPDGAARFLERYGISYPNVFDDSGEVRRALGLRGFPTTYIFDAEGIGRTTVIGGISEQQLAAQLDDLLA